MGEILEVTSHIGWGSAFLAAAALGLAGCGSDTDATAGARLVKSTATQIIQNRKKAGTAAPAITRADLAAFNTPMIQAEVPTLGLTTYLVPFGQNAGVETWSTVEDQTVSFRQGIMVATRGFGPDIMQATAPTIAQVASGSGNYARAYYYLDGADQIQRFDYHCSLATVGVETIAVVNQQHTTRHVTESCTGKQGDFVNEYWFENGTFLRQSKQLLIKEWGAITFRRVIDNG